MLVSRINKKNVDNLQNFNYNKHGVNIPNMENGVADFAWPLHKLRKNNRRSCKDDGGHFFSKV